MTKVSLFHFPSLGATLTVFVEGHADCLGVKLEGSCKPARTRSTSWPNTSMSKWRHCTFLALSGGAHARVVAHSNPHAGVVAHSSPSELGLEIYSCSPSFFREATFVNALPLDEMSSTSMPPALSEQSNWTHRFRLRFFAGVSGLVGTLPARCFCSPPHIPKGIVITLPLVCQSLLHAPIASRRFLFSLPCLALRPFSTMCGLAVHSLEIS